MMPELAGALREYVVVENRTGGRDAWAGATGGYSYGGHAWAAFDPIGFGALQQGDAVSANPRWRVTMRKRDGVDLQARLTWRGKYLAVRGIISDPREPAHMILTCEEVR